MQTVGNILPDLSVETFAEILHKRGLAETELCQEDVPQDVLEDLVAKGDLKEVEEILFGWCAFL